MNVRLVLETTATSTTIVETPFRRGYEYLAYRVVQRLFPRTVPVRGAMFGVDRNGGNCSISDRGGPFHDPRRGRRILSTGCQLRIRFRPLDESLFVVLGKSRVRHGSLPMLAMVVVVVESFRSLLAGRWPGRWEDVVGR